MRGGVPAGAGRCLAETARQLGGERRANFAGAVGTDAPPEMERAAAAGTDLLKACPTVRAEKKVVFDARFAFRARALFFDFRQQTFFFERSLVLFGDRFARPQQ
jgi:hypothetical protein